MLWGISFNLQDNPTQLVTNGKLIFEYRALVRTAAHQDHIPALQSGGFPGAIQSQSTARLDETVTTHIQLKQQILVIILDAPAAIFYGNYGFFFSGPRLSFSDSKVNIPPRALVPST